MKTCRKETTMKKLGLMVLAAMSSVFVYAESYIGLSTNGTIEVFDESGALTASYNLTIVTPDKYLDVSYGDFIPSNEGNELALLRTGTYVEFYSLNGVTNGGNLTLAHRLAYNVLDPVGSRFPNSIATAGNMLMTQSGDAYAYTYIPTNVNGTMLSRQTFAALYYGHDPYLSLSAGNFPSDSGNYSLVTVAEDQSLETFIWNGLTDTSASRTRTGYISIRSYAGTDGVDAFITSGDQIAMLNTNNTLHFFDYDGTQPDWLSITYTSNTVSLASSSVLKAITGTTPSITPALPFDEIADPANLLINGDLTMVTNETTVGLATYRVTGSNGDYPSNDGNYADVVGWTHYNADPNALATYTDAGEVLDGTDKLSTSFKPDWGRIYLSSAMGYRNGMMQSDIFNGTTVNPDLDYRFSIEVVQNAAKDHSLSTFTAALTAGSGAAATNTANAVSGSLLQVTPTTGLPTAAGSPYQLIINGSDLLAAQSEGPVNVIFDLLNTDTITGFPEGPVDVDDAEEMSQVLVYSVSLTFVPAAGDVNKDGWVNREDVDLALYYLEGAGGDSATNRMDSLISIGLTSEQALEALNLTDFDVDGDGYFDADDIALIQALAPRPVLAVDCSGSGLSFSWNSQSGLTYDIESTESLTDPNWVVYDDGEAVHTNIFASGTGTNTVSAASASEPVRFFRIIEKD